MPIPISTLEDALVTVCQFESSLLEAVAQQDPKEVFWCAGDLLLFVGHSRYWEARCRAGHAIIRALEAAGPGPNRDAIEQALSGAEYRYPRGAKPPRNARPKTGGALERTRRAQRPPAAAAGGATAKTAMPPVTIN